MTYAEQIIPEFNTEMSSTRRLLERLPEDKWDWKVHPKSNTIGWNANHLVEIVSWVAPTFSGTSWDVYPPGGERYVSPNLRSVTEILANFDDAVRDARAALQAVPEHALDEPWSLMEQGQPLLTMPRRDVIRTFILNHLIHHRGVLTVSLRLNNIPVPGMYGPSGDE